MLIVPATAADAPEIDRLLDAAFGPDRRQRTASRLRERASPIAELCRVARDGDRLMGSIQFWPIELVAAETVALTLLGPIAVAAGARKIGLGRRLLAASLAAADLAGHAAIMLIGDLDYYGPFGFSAAATAGWTLPGPVERHRLLLRRSAAAPVLPAVATVRGRTTTDRLAA